MSKIRVYLIKEGWLIVTNSTPQKGQDRMVKKYFPDAKRAQKRDVHATALFGIEWIEREGFIAGSIQEIKNKLVINGVAPSGKKGVLNINLL